MPSIAALCKAVKLNMPITNGEDSTKTPRRRKSLFGCCKLLTTEEFLTEVDSARTSSSAERRQKKRGKKREYPAAQVDISTEEVAIENAKRAEAEIDNPVPAQENMVREDAVVSKEACDSFLMQSEVCSGDEIFHEQIEHAHQTSEELAHNTTFVRVNTLQTGEDAHKPHKNDVERAEERNKDQLIRKKGLDEGKYICVITLYQKHLCFTYIHTYIRTANIGICMI